MRHIYMESMYAIYGINHSEEYTIYALCVYTYNSPLKSNVE